MELNPVAPQEIRNQHNRCEAKHCICPNGRSHVTVGTIWELFLCINCESRSVHFHCGNLTLPNLKWECGDCSLKLQHARKGSPATVNKISSKRKKGYFKGSGGLQRKKYHKRSVQSPLSHRYQSSSESPLMPKAGPMTPISLVEVSDDDDDDDDDSSDYGNSSKSLHSSVDCSSQPSTSGTARPTTFISLTAVSDDDGDDDGGSSDYDNSSKSLHSSVDVSSQPSTSGTARPTTFIPLIELSDDDDDDGG
jgi:hypothetical protein